MPSHLQLESKDQLRVLFESGVLSIYCEVCCYNINVYYVRCINHYLMSNTFVKECFLVVKIFCNLWQLFDHNFKEDFRQEIFYSDCILKRDRFECFVLYCYLKRKKNTPPVKNRRVTIIVMSLNAKF